MRDDAAPRIAMATSGPTPVAPNITCCAWYAPPHVATSHSAVSQTEPEVAITLSGGLISVRSHRNFACASCDTDPPCDRIVGRIAWTRFCFGESRFENPVSRLQLIGL